MMFFMEGLESGAFTWNDLPVVVLSAEEKERIKNVSLEEMVAYLRNLREGKRKPEFTLKKINP